MLNKAAFPIRLIRVAKAFTVGLAYYLVADIPGLTSSFVAVFVALLPFDLIIAMPKFSLTIKHWEELIVTLLPRISATAVTLGKGLLLGALFGGLVQLRFPAFLGAVLTIGFAYHIALETKGNISSYVGILGGLSLFDQIVRLEAFAGTLVSSILRTAVGVFSGTFTALLVGWVVGILAGIITRLFLPRGYRSTKSSAYALPLVLQPFKDVVHVDEENMVIVRVAIGDMSPLVEQPLSESGLRMRFEATVLSIIRSPKDVVAPKGNDIIHTGDVLVILTPPRFATELLEYVKGSADGEQI